MDLHFDLHFLEKLLDFGLYLCKTMYIKFLLVLTNVTRTSDNDR